MGNHLANKTPNIFLMIMSNLFDLHSGALNRLAMALLPSLLTMATSITQLFAACAKVSCEVLIRYTSLTFMVIARKKSEYLMVRKMRMSSIFDRAWLLVSLSNDQ